MFYVFVIPVTLWVLLGLYFWCGKKTKVIVGWIILAYLLSFLGATMLMVITKWYNLSIVH